MTVKKTVTRLKALTAGLLWFSYFGFRTSVSVLRFPYFGFRTSVSVLRFPYFGFRTSVSVLRFPHFRFRTSVSALKRFPLAPYATDIAAVKLLKS